MAKIQLVKAINDGKGLGNTINALASQLEACTIIMRATGEKIKCNSTWAATDYLKANGFYIASEVRKPVEYDLTW